MTWTCWWMRVVGPSVPARRPFFRPSSDVPSLARNASNYADEDVFVYTLAGGWPTINSVFRILPSLLAMIASFSFALIAMFASHRLARKIFSVTFLVLAVLALVAAILDSIAIATASSECAKKNCVTSVPKIVRDSSVICKCAVEGWFFLTLVADVILLGNALICFVLTVKPSFAANVAYPT